MLPEPLHQLYLDFFNRLEVMRAIALQSNPDPRTLQTTFLDMQQFFQQTIVSIVAEMNLESAIASQVQSYQTEINKQLRLLGMDVMFLQAARQPVTTQKRQAQMGDRFSLLARYCQVLLGTADEEG
jgi:hypothetical protein